MKLDGVAGTGLIWLWNRDRWLADDCECNNEPLGSIKYLEFLD